MNYGALAPKDAAAARQMLLEIVDRATERCKRRRRVFRELAELDADSAADRLSWDDTPEGERLRRYELTCKRTWFGLFDLLLKIRQKGGELDIATVAVNRPLRADRHHGLTIDQPAPTVARRHHPTRRARRAARTAERSQFGSGKCAERSQFACSGAQSRASGWA